MDYSNSQRLILAGGVLLVAALPLGSAILFVPNPVTAVHAHLGALMFGMLLLILGLMWSQVRLPPALANTACALMIYGGGSGLAALVWALIFHTSSGTPLTGSGMLASRWRELGVNFLFGTSGIAVYLGLPLIVWGLWCASRADRTNHA